MAKILTPKQAALAIKKKFDPLGGDEIVVSPTACDDKGMTPRQLGELIVKGAGATGFAHTVAANAAADDAKAVTTAGLDDVLTEAEGAVEVGPPGTFRIHVAGDAGEFFLPIKQGAINNLHISWGDGSSQDLAAPLADGNGVSHTYANRTKPYTIGLSGTTYNAGPYTATNCGALGFGFTALTTGYGAGANKAKIIGAGGAPFSLLPDGPLAGDSNGLQRLGAYLFFGCTGISAFDSDFDLAGGMDRLGAAGDAGYYLQYALSGCSGLAAAPELPALPGGVTAANYYLDHTFSSCSFMTAAPEIPALPAGVASADYYLHYTFYNCFPLSSVPALPALPSGVTSADYYLYYTFQSCTSLSSAPALPALPAGVSSVDYYFARTFSGCQALSYSPALPALPAGVLSVGHYLYYAFAECRSLSTAPALPPLPSGVTAVSFYLQNAFYLCTELSAAPAIPALPGSVTLLSNYLVCVFQGCNNIIGSPALPALPSALIGGSYTYYRTFYNCTELETSVNTILPAAAVPTGSYSSTAFNQMFFICTKLTGSGVTAVTSRATVPSTVIQCFTNCTSLSDYDSIPAAWK